jgi:hypothetical protein
MVIARDILRAGARAGGALALALGAGGALGACESILRLQSGDRYVDPHVSCASGDCVCIGGFDDCDGDEDNGCEADLTHPDNCGACGNVCTNGACAGSACTCSAGFADCDGDPATGCETTPATDENNCGACGHRCLGGACAGGLCQPVNVAGLDGAVSIAVASGQIFAAMCGDVPIVSAFGNGTGSTPAVNANGCSRLVAVVGNQIFWTKANAVFENPTDTVTLPTQLADMTTPLRLLGASDTHVYWWSSDGTTKALLRAPIVTGMGTGVETVATGTVDALAADATTAYWSDATGLHAVQQDVTMPTALNPVHAYALAVDGADLFVGDAKGVERLDATGGPTTPIGAAQMAAAIAVDAANVYIADHGDSKVKRVGRDGTGLTVLATKETFAAGTTIAVDDQAIYWISGQRVRMLAK